MPPWLSARSCPTIQACSVTGAAESIAAAVLRTYRLVTPVWIEYRPEETTVAGVESFELVAFSDYNVRETVSLAASRVELGPSRSGSPWTDTERGGSPWSAARIGA